MIKYFFLSLLLFNFNAYASEGRYSINIPIEVAEAMDLSAELVERLAGGDIIGNGGGLLEQEFRFAYRKIPSAIDSCVASNLCPLAESDSQLLELIKEIASKAVVNKDNLIFLSEAEYPGFFRDNGEGPIRIAKTAFIAGAPIFINLDMIYTETGAAVDYPLMTAILVHELGHQAKVRSHSLLDDLGSKLRDYLMQDSTSISQQLSGALAMVKIYNLKEANKFAEIFFTYRGTIVSLKERVREKLVCKKRNSIPIGFEVTNIHWLRTQEVNENFFNVPIQAWIQTFCLDLASSAIRKEDSDLNVIFSFEEREEGRAEYLWSNITINKL